MAVNYRDNTPFEGDNHTVGELAKAIRTKMYGVDVREPIAQAVEKMENWTKGNNIGQIVATPTKVFEDLEDLQNSYPNGADGVFVTVDNGHKYYWQNNQWNDGGAYQAVGLNLDETLFASGQAPDSSVVGAKIRDVETSVHFGSYVITPSWKMQAYNVDTGQTITGSSTNPSQMSTEKIRLSDRSNFLSYYVKDDYFLFLMWFGDNGTFISTDARLTGENTIAAKSKNVIAVVTKKDFSGTMTANDKWNVELFQNKEAGGQTCYVIDSNSESNMANVDTVANTITFSGAYSKLFLGAENIDIKGKTIDFSSISQSWGHIFYDSATREFICSGAGFRNHLSNGHLSYFGSVWNNGKTVDLNIFPAYKIDGVVTTHGDTFRKTTAPYKMAVLGDSISTFEGVSEDTGNGSTHPVEYYPADDVTSSDDLWWSIVNRKLGFERTPSVSAYSRSSYAKQDDTIPAGFYDARINRLGSDNQAPSHIFLALGMNDAFNTIGENPYKFTVSDLADYHNTVYGGTAETIIKVKAKYPNAKIIVVLPKTVNFANSTFTFEHFVKVKRAIKEIAEDFGADKVVDLGKCGINQENVLNHTVNNASKSNGIHPNKAGHALMADYIVSQVRDLF